MRQPINNYVAQGYVYDTSKLNFRVTGENSKNPGTEYISGDLEIVTDESGMNVVPVHFTFCAAVYAKSKKPNATFALLKKLMDNPSSTWLNSGKDAAKVKVEGSVQLNDFVSSDGSMVAAKRCEGSFVTAINQLPSDPSDRNQFTVDMVITRANIVEANEERHIDEDYMVIGGAIFDSYRKSLLPMEFHVKNKGGMKHFENLAPSNSEPVYTKVWGSVLNQTIVYADKEESAFGETKITSREFKSKEWIVVGSAKVPYEFGDENILTGEELMAAQQDRETYLAEVRKRDEDYRASRAAADNGFPTATPSAATPVKVADYKF